MVDERSKESDDVIRIAAILLLSGLASSTVFAQAERPHDLVAEGNTAFDAGDFAAALASYSSAGATLPDSPELAYNQGVAHYRLGDFEAARGAFNRALLTRDINLEADAKFNLGDVAYASALEKQSELEEAIDLLKTAMGHYRDVLEIKPDDQDARRNIEMAQLLIKDLLDKQKQEQEQQDQNKDQDQQQDQEKKEQEEKDPQDQQEQQKEKGDEQKDQEDQSQSHEGEQDEDQKQQDQHQQQQDQEQQEEQKQQEQQAQAESAKEMTDAEAERLLQGVRDREKQRRDEKRRMRRVGRVPVLKDW